MTKASGTIVSSGEYRRSRDPEKSTYRRRIGFRRKRTAINECYRAEDEYRRSRDPEKSTYRRRIDLRRKRTTLNKY